jgi:thiol-disulfide isomerase/thioredoxin
LLVQEVASEYAGKVRFVSENLGNSPLAERFGVKGYPAVFVEDVLVARPGDFGYFGQGKNPGRYAPWRNADNQARFKVDVKRMIDQVLAGKKEELARERAAAPVPDQVQSLPAFKLTDLSGRELSDADVNNRVVLVEFWATWCPPCASTLKWLGELKGKYGDRVAILALAVESPDDKIRTTVSSIPGDIHWAIPDAKTASAFGDVVAVPTLLIFDASGKTAGAMYGAPPDLHEKVEKTLDGILKQ